MKRTNMARLFMVLFSFSAWCVTLNNVDIISLPVLYEVIQNLYSSPTMRVIKSKRIGWAGHVARIGEKRNVCVVLVRKFSSSNFDVLFTRPILKFYHTNIWQLYVEPLRLFPNPHIRPRCGCCSESANIPHSNLVSCNRSQVAEKWGTRNGVPTSDGMYHGLHSEIPSHAVHC